MGQTTFRGRDRVIWRVSMTLAADNPVRVDKLAVVRRGASDARLSGIFQQSVERRTLVMRMLLCMFLSTSTSRVAADQTTFDPVQDGSLAFKTLHVAKPGDWEVQMRLSNSARDLQKQFADKVLQRSLSADSGAAQAPALPVHLLVTVTGVYGTTLRVIQEFDIHEEPLNQSRKQSLQHGGIGNAYFSVKQLHLNKGTYTVALRVMEADPALEGFESSLLVESAHK